MGYKLNIAVEVPVTVETAGTPLPSAVFSCPVCDGNTDACYFCLGTGQVTADKLATYEPSYLE